MRYLRFSSTFLAMCLFLVVLPQSTYAQQQESVPISFQQINHQTRSGIWLNCQSLLVGIHADPVGNGDDRDYSYDLSPYTGPSPNDWTGLREDIPGERITFGSRWAASSGPDYDGDKSCSFKTLSPPTGDLNAYYTPPPNEPPTACFTYDEADELLTINFDASCSTDEDGEVVSYTWDFGGAGTGGGGEQASFTYDEGGEYEVTLTVRDDDGDDDSVSEDVEVEGPAMRYELVLSRFTETASKRQGEEATTVQVGDSVLVQIRVENTGELDLEEIQVTGGEAGISVPGEPEAALMFVRAERAMIEQLEPGETDSLLYVYEAVHELEEGNVEVPSVEAQAVSAGGDPSPFAETIDGCAVGGKNGPLALQEDSAGCALITVAPAPFVVNSTGDDPLDDGLDPEEDGCSTGGSIMRDGTPETECTLRAALATANAQAQQGEAVTILFDIPGTGPHGIAVGEPLVLDNHGGGQITIDALGKGGTAFVPELPIFLYGTGPSVGLDIYGTALIRGLSIADFTYGIRLQSGSTVEKTHLTRNFTGILVQGGSNTIQESVISNNTGEGVRIEGTAAQQNKVADNYIGTDYLAAAALGNDAGIYLTDGASSNEVSSNVVSGNNTWGIVADRGSQANYIASNFIGLDITAQKALPNRDGVGLVGASNNTLYDNFIAGNTVSEVIVRGGEEGVAEGNLIQGNFIGVNYTITKAVGLGFVFLENADNNMVGGATPDLGNYVQAVRIDGGTNNTVASNYIGLQPNREPLAGAENSIRYGIRLANEAHQNVIQTNTVAFRSQQGIVIDSAADANRVEYNEVFLNGGAGIGVLPDAAPTNALRANAIFDNWGLGIDLGNDGVNYYNAPAGEAWTPAPYIEAVYTSDAKDTADIWMYVPASDGTYIVDFYAVRQSSADPVRVGCDTSGFGEGEQWIGSNGNIVGGVTLAGTHAIPPGYTHIAATATREDGGTSEFSWCQAIAEAENAAAVPFDCSQNGLVVNERGVRLLVTDTDGTSGAGENMLYVARFEEEPANNLFAGTATTNDGTLGTPDHVQSRYYSMEATGALANPPGSESSTCQVTYDLCLDATNQTTENNFDSLLLLQRNRRTSYVWTPHDTRIEQQGDTRYACASSLTDFGEFSFGLINATEIAAPQLLSPENDATDVLLGSALSWQVMPDANSYDVQVALDAGFTVLLTDTTGLASTTVIPDSLARDRLHYWRVRGVMASGEAGPWSVPLRFSTGATGVAVEAEAEMPKAFVLEANYPNPFNPQTTIGFALPQASEVRLVVYDVLGREVARLIEGTLSAGRHEAVFDASGLPTGVYLYRLEADGFVQTRRMLLVK